MMFNKDNVVSSEGDFTPEQFAENLPGYENNDYWNILYNDTVDLTYMEYYKAVNDTHFNGQTESHNFGSF